MNYRICIATSGSYYVQRKGWGGWTKVGGFFRTRRGAEIFLSDYRGSVVPCGHQIVGYY